MTYNTQAILHRNKEIRNQYKHLLINLNESIYSLNYRDLNERFGVFDYDDKYYFKLFKDIIKVATHNLLSLTPDTISLYKDFNVKYFKKEIHNLKYELCNLDTLKLYITLDAEYPEFYSIIDNSEDNYICNDELPVFNKTSDNKFTASIILNFNKATYKNYTLDEIAGILLHELLHIMHTIKSPVIIKNTISANILAAQLMNDYINENKLPDFNDLKNVYNELKNNNWEFQTKKSLITFIATCIYYSDLSERAGYISNFMVDVERSNDALICQSNYIGYFFNVKHSETFCIYYILLNIFTHMYMYSKKSANIRISQYLQYKDIIDFLLKNYPIRKHLKDIKRSYAVKTLNNFCSMWKKAIHKWKHNAIKIISDYIEKLVDLK